MSQKYLSLTVKIEKDRRAQEVADLRRQLAESEARRVEQLDAASRELEAERARAQAQGQAQGQAQTAAASIPLSAGAYEFLIGAVVDAARQQPGTPTPWKEEEGVLDWVRVHWCSPAEAAIVGQVTCVLKSGKKDRIALYIAHTMGRVTNSPLATALLRLAKANRL